jgi:hypothetical protein
MVDETPLIKFNTPDEIAARPNYFPTLKIQKGELARIVGGYEFDKANEMRCGLNNCNTRHQRGYVIATKANQETHCGNECGKREFGVTFEDMEGRFKEAFRRQTSISTLRELQETADARLAEAQRLLEAKNRVYGKLVNIRDEFRRDPDLNRVLETLFRLDGAVRVRAEQTPAEKELRQSGNANIRTVGRIEGIAALTGFARTANMIDNEILHPLRAVKSMDGDSIAPKELDHLVRQMNNLPAAIVAVEEFLSDATLFLKKSNLDEIRKMRHLDGVRSHKLERVIETIAPLFA